jgi:hypothetical protein
MKMANRLALLLVLCAVIVGPAISAQTNGRMNVTTTVHDENTLPNDLLLRSDDYQGTPPYQANYVTTGCEHPNSTCLSTSVGTSPGAWSLNLYGQSLRTIWLTLSKPVGNSPPSPAPDGYYSQFVEVYSRCWDSNNQEVPYLSIAPGTSQNRCNFGLDFGYDRVKYKLVMGPYIPSLGVNTTGTGWASVSCNSGSGGVCKNWTITPYMNAGNGNIPTVANLYKFTNKGLAYIGQYYNTYRIDAATNP